MLTLEQFEAGVRAGDRAVLGRAISLVESSNASHQALAGQLLARLMPWTGLAIRVGITGVPGAGKSTFIEKLGTFLTSDEGGSHRVAVLAVDPSSDVTGGSILGDRTRMSKLSADPRAFIRPSPSGGTLGGVARRTRETILVCEAAGYDVVLVETVGVGQSESAVAGMSDVFLAVMLAGAGDDLQGIKRGILEHVDVIAVNKADGGNEKRAQMAAREYEMALRMVSARAGEGKPTARTCSALTGAGVREVWADVEGRVTEMRRSGRLDEKRREQNLSWLEELVRDRLEHLIRESSGASGALEDARDRVRQGLARPTAEADRVIQALKDSLAENGASAPREGRIAQT
jgi:LAO/AO transport system kinase